MISADFAPNESWDDAWLSLKLLFQPWRWKNGPELGEIKKRILDLLSGTRSKFHVLPFLSGRSALFHLLKFFQLPKDSEVIIQAFTCEAVVLPILANNLKPVYIDIEAETYSMDPIDLESKITPKARVLILQHTFGLTPNRRTEIVELVKKHNLVLIEDIAHTIKSLSKEGFKTTSFYLMSFGRSKAVSSVFGGAIVTNKNLAIKQLSLPSYGFIARLLFYKPLSVLIKSTYDFYLGKILHKIINKLQILVPEISAKEKRVGLDSILDKAYPNALAILLLHQLDKYEQIQRNRALSVAYYSKNRNKSPLIRFPILVGNRKHLLKQAAKKNVYLGKWYDQVVAPKDLDLAKLGYKLGCCPVAEEICRKIINLPTVINKKGAEKIMKLIEEYGN